MGTVLIACLAILLDRMFKMDMQQTQTQAATAIETGKKSATGAILAMVNHNTMPATVYRVLDTVYRVPTTLFPERFRKVLIFC